jgi:hypothetical protein
MREAVLIPERPADLTYHWLRGALDHDVARVAIIEARDTAASHCCRIEATSGNGRVQRLFVKFSKPPRAWTMLPWGEQLGAMNENEFDFYDAVRQGVAPAVPCTDAVCARGRQPVVPCHALAIAEDKRVLLILDDVTASHMPATAELAPCLSALGRLHAAWWNSDLPGRIVGRRLAPAGIDANSQMPDGLPVRRRTLTRWILDHRDALFAPQGPPTLLHADGNIANFLFPRDARRDVPLLVDWQTSRAGTPADDLARLLVARVPPEARPTLEHSLLRHWLEELNANGATYEWDDLLADYRRSVFRFLALSLFTWEVSAAVRERAFRAAEFYGAP